MSRRAALDALHAGPALVARLPAEVVDIDRLLAHLSARTFQGGVHVAGEATDGLVWIYDGAPQEVWLFERGGTEAVLHGDSGRDLIRQMAGKGATVSVLVGAPPAVQPFAPAPAETIAPVPHPHEETPTEPHRQAAPRRPDALRDASEERVAPEPAQHSPESEGEAVRSGDPGPGVPRYDEPPPQPWPAILEDVAERVARHRGPRLAARFVTALEAALAPYGGRITHGRISAPPLDRSTWRVVVETACAPVVAIAGRAFVDRTIAAAERDVSARGKDGS